MKDLYKFWTLLTLLVVLLGVSACGGSMAESPASSPVSQVLSEKSPSAPPAETPEPTMIVATVEIATARPSETPTSEPTLAPTESPTPPTPPATPTPLRIAVASTAFESGAIIPERYARSGDNLSMPLSWSDAPEGIESYAILFVGDPVADGGGTWILWALYNLPGDIQSLPEGLVPDDQGLLEIGGQHLENSYLEFAYSGPPTHPIETRRFYLRLYALDTMLETADIDEAAATVNTWIGGTELTLLKAMEGPILATGQLSGKYKGESPVG